MVLGVVESVWRYPVKSTGGEPVDRVEVEERGLVGDRLWAVRDADGKFGSGKNSRRFRRMPGLLALRSRCAGDGVEVLDPDGSALSEDGLRAWLGRAEVALVREGDVSHFDELPVSVLSTATLEWFGQALPGVPVDERRFRPNVVVRTPPGTPPFVEDAWLGRELAVGGVRLAVVRSSERCVMVNEEQPGLPRSSDVLRKIADAHDNKLGVLARVLVPGGFAVGDEVALCT
nr:MOSC domain-containing protein [Saccharothrix mutabilis subsp. capreolus]